jgi:hypothetical protein
LTAIGRAARLIDRAATTAIIWLNRGDVLIYCADYPSQNVRMKANQQANDVCLSDIEDKFTWKACGRRGADVQPDFSAAKAGCAEAGRRLWRSLIAHVAGGHATASAMIRSVAAVAQLKQGFPVAA